MRRTHSDKHLPIARALLIALAVAAIVLTAAAVDEPTPRTLAEARQVPQLQPAGFSSSRGYAWPMDAPIRISSNFGEYRIGHPHAGIDLSSYGEIGLPVLAVADGWICRLHTSPYGYGKTIYLCLGDGNSAVYAHLDAMIEPIWARMRAQHQQVGSYTADLFLEPGDIPIKRGQVIGYQGNTGTDAPHLHFELRGPDNCPLNPLTNGFERPDTRPPQPLELYVEPLSPGATVNGGRALQVLPLSYSDGAWRVARTINVSGEVGFGLRVRDFIDGSDRVLAPYRLRTLLDGRKIFEEAFERTCYEGKQVIDHAYDLDLFLSRGRHYHRLFRKWVTRTYFDVGTEDGVVRDLAQGEHRLRIEALDASGNLSPIELRLIANQPPELRSWQALDGPDGRSVLLEGSDPDNEPLTAAEAAWSADNGRTWRQAAVQGAQPWHAVLPANAGPTPLVKARLVDPHGLCSAWRLFYAGTDGSSPSAAPVLSVVYKLHDLYTELIVSSSQPLAHEPSVALRSINGNADDAVLLPSSWIGDNRYSAIVDNNNIVGGTLLVTVRGADRWGRPIEASRSMPLQLARDGARLSSADGVMRVRFAPGSVPRPFYSTIEPTAAPEPGESLEQVGGAYAIERKGAPLGGKITVSLQLPPDQAPQGVGVYYYASGRWWQMGFAFDPAARTISGQAPQLGTFALLRDTARPYLKLTGPAPGAKLRQRRPAFTYIAGDAGSGIDPSSVVFKLDGRRVVGEDSGPRGWLKYVPDSDLTAGEHLLELSVTDRAGNSRSVQQSFTILF